MKKAIIFLVSNLFLLSFAYSQANQNAPAKDATFCAKVGQGGPAPQGNYSIEDLKNCDWKIIPVDPNLTVVEFQMSLVSKNNLYPYSEMKIKGNMIPESYRNKILTQTKNVFLEYIKAVDKSGKQELIKPIAVRL